MSRCSGCGFWPGLGGGIFTAVAVTTLGGSSKPARAYNLMLFAFAFSQAAEMQVLPMLSMNGIYWVFIVCFLLSLPFLRCCRPTLTHSADANARVAAPGSSCVFALAMPGSHFLYLRQHRHLLDLYRAGITGCRHRWRMGGRMLVIVSFGSLLGCLIATLSAIAGGWRGRCWLPW